MTRSSFRFLIAPPAGLLFVIAILMLAAESNRVNAVVGDIDDDGVPDAVDNCPTVANPTQANTDVPQDSKGDACDLIVRTVPWKGSPAAPHETYMSAPITLQGVASVGYNDTAVTLTNFTWDPGDGSAPVTVAGGNSLALERVHAYTANGLYEAKLTARATISGAAEVASSTFLVQVKPKDLDVEINLAIDRGLWALHKTITRATSAAPLPVGVPIGSWPYANSPISATSGAVQAFAINNHLTSGNVAVDPYIHDVSRGLRWLEGVLRVQAINNQTATPVGQPARNDNPDTNRPDHPANGIGLFANDNSVNYIVGQVMDAFVASGTPNQVAILGHTSLAPNGAVLGGVNYVTNRTYKAIVQDMIDFNAWSQIDTGAGRGGWAYGQANNASATPDNSVSQWAAIGGIAAERVWGLTTPAFVKSENRLWVAASQNVTASSANGVALHGSFGYNGTTAAWSEGAATSPSALIQYIYDGVRNVPGVGSSTPQTPERRFQDGLAFLARYHRLRTSSPPGNIYVCCDSLHGGQNFYALYATAKTYRLALNAAGSPEPITLVDDNPADGVPAWDWFRNDPAVGAPLSAGPKGMARAVISTQTAGNVATQVSGGSWAGISYYTGNLSTAWAVIILSPTLFDLGPEAVCSVNPSEIGTAGGTVAFDGGDSFHQNPERVIVSYSWNFGDGTAFGSGVTTNHAYGPSAVYPRTYTATLTVTDDQGLTDTTNCSVIHVDDNVAPNAHVGGNVMDASGNIIRGEYELCMGGEPLILDGSGSTDPEGGPLAYSWDWTLPINHATADASTETFDATAVFTARGPGSYPLNLRVTDNVNKTDDDPGTVTVRLATDPLCNQPPVAMADTYAVNEDAVLSGNVLDNDTDDHDMMTAMLDAGPAHGQLVLNGNGSFTFTPSADYHGPDSFTYHAHDGQYASEVVTVSITVTAVNDAPVADAGSATTDEDVAVSGQVTSSDIDGGAPSYALGAQASNGTAAVNLDGTYTYTPNADFNGSDSFTYTVDDGHGGSDTETVSITVNPVNDAPVANAGSATTNEDVAVSGQVTSSDIDGGAPSYGLGAQASNGIAVVNADGTFTYTPNADFNGIDSFTYTVDDGHGGSDTETVSITVNGVNDAPVADAGSATTDEDMAVSGQVTSSDIDGGAPNYALATQASNGTVGVNADGTFSYTPNANFNGSDSFTYIVDDGRGGSDIETVTIIVNAVNDAPVAAPLSPSTNEDTPLLGTVPVHDVDGDPLTVTLVAGVSHGTLVLNGNGSFAYTPALNYNGPDSFTYQVSDGRGGVAVGTVNITVVPVNDNPVCSVSPNIDEIWPPNHRMVPITLSGATDVDGNTVTLLVTGIFQDEPTNTVGDGNTASDATGVGTSTPSVRAERSGTPRTPGDGRVYHIQFTGRDGVGGSCTGEVTVGVPHDQGARTTLVDGGALYNSVTGAPVP